MLTKLYTKNFVCIWGYYDYRFNEDSSYEEPVATYSPEPIAICSPERPLSYDDQQSESSLPRLLANDIDTIFSGFPPSFTELLTNCSTETEKGYSSKLTFITNIFPFIIAWPLISPYYIRFAEQHTQGVDAKPALNEVIF